MTVKRGLGRGLSDLGLNELLSDSARAVQAVVQDNTNGTSLLNVPIKQLQPSPYQPRRIFETAALDELADSIRSQGIIQPIVVRRSDPEHFDHYEIVAGERRWRAAQLAGLDEVPVVLRDMTADDALAVALIENIQRENLNAIEEAVAMQRLGETLTLTHEQIGELVGKSRSTVTNALRLLSLGDVSRSLLESRHIEVGHARALLALDETQQGVMAQTIVEKKLSVREAESLINKEHVGAAPEKTPRTDHHHLKEVSETLTDQLGAQVAVRQAANGKGKIVIHFEDASHLDSLLAHIRGHHEG